VFLIIIVAGVAMVICVMLALIFYFGVKYGNKADELHKMWYQNQMKEAKDETVKQILQAINNEKNLDSRK
jgi:uncharacterized membrane protein YvbJ